MQSRSFLVAAALALCLPACVTVTQSGSSASWVSRTAVPTVIGDLLSDQKDAWNRGDIDAFMETYWQSPELRFASGGNVTYGWQETRDRYHARYSNRALMGELDFSELEFEVLSPDAVVVHGAWALQRDTDRPSGLFTLIFRKLNGEWKIVSDTTTSAG